MPTQQLNFFATYGDIGKVLDEFEEGGGVTYVRTGLFECDVPQVFGTYRAINSLSIAVDGNVNNVPGYLILKEGICDPITIRKVQQKSGGVKFAIDQYQNHDTLYFQSGGTFSNQIIVPGKIGVTNRTAISGALYSSFAKLVTKNFCKVKTYYVGQEAHSLWQNGMRLGLSLKASPDLDLR